MENAIKFEIECHVRKKDYPFKLLGDGRILIFVYMFAVSKTGKYIG